ncbi:hypothetical protein [Saccharopolyspora erythraea]|nr:hypothetical protein [Saccharopolyspora erythraea]
MSNARNRTVKLLIKLSVVAASATALRKLAARSNTQVHRINQK